jgi:hypothetical protein
MRLIGVDHADLEMMERIDSAVSGPVLVEGLHPSEQMTVLDSLFEFEEKEYDTCLDYGETENPLEDTEEEVEEEEYKKDFDHMELDAPVEDVEEKEEEIESGQVEENRAVLEAVPEDQVVFLDEGNPYYTEAAGQMLDSYSPHRIEDAINSLRPGNEMGAEDAFILMNTGVEGSERLYELMEGRPEGEPAEAVFQHFRELTERRGEEFTEEDMEELRQGTQEINDYFPTWEDYRQELLDEGVRFPEMQEREQYWMETVDAAVEAYGEGFNVVTGASHAMPAEGNFYDKLTSEYDVETVTLREAAD